jgi:hypothetical protein
MTDTTNPPARFMVVTQQVVGNPADWSMDYSSDLETFADRQKAIDHGLKVHGHDDFNIATVDSAGNLVTFGFDHTDWPDPVEDYDAAEITRQLGLPESVARRQPVPCVEYWYGHRATETHADGVHRCSFAAGLHRVHECGCGVQRYVPDQAKARSPA